MFVKIAKLVLEDKHFFLAKALPPPPSVFITGQGTCVDTSFFKNRGGCVSPKSRMSLNEILREMKTGSLEGQQAAATALVQCCTSKEICMQLVASGQMLEIAGNILAEATAQKRQVLNHPHQIPPKTPTSMTPL